MMGDEVLRTLIYPCGLLERSLFAFDWDLGCGALAHWRCGRNTHNLHTVLQWRLLPSVGIDVLFSLGEIRIHR